MIIGRTCDGPAPTSLDVRQSDSSTRPGAGIGNSVKESLKFLGYPCGVSTSFLLHGLAVFPP